MAQSPNSCATRFQADALAAVVELEALWENLPQVRAVDSPDDSGQALIAKRQAFDTFWASLVTYNRQFRPPYHGGRPATTPRRLGAWCRRLADLYQRVDRAACPVQLLDKAHQCADRLAARLAAAACPRVKSPAGPADAAADLRSVADWCDRLVAERNPG